MRLFRAAPIKVRITYDDRFEVTFYVYVRFRGPDDWKQELAVQSAEKLITVDFPQHRGGGEYQIGVQAKQADGRASQLVWSDPFLWGVDLPDPVFELLQE